MHIFAVSPVAAVIFELRRGQCTDASVYMLGWLTALNWQQLLSVGNFTGSYLLCIRLFTVHMSTAS